METTDYVDYPTAVALKECGFDEPCNYGYSVKTRLEPELSFGSPKIVHSKTPKNFNDNRKGIEKGQQFCSAVPLWQAQKWLRGKKGIAINVIAHDGGAYDYDIVFLPNAVDCDYPIDRATFSRTYEEALSEGIASALDLLAGKEGELWYSADIVTTKGFDELVDGGFDYLGYKAALSAGLNAALDLPAGKEGE